MLLQFPVSFTRAKCNSYREDLTKKYDLRILGGGVRVQNVLRI